MRRQGLLAATIVLLVTVACDSGSDRSEATPRSQAAQAAAAGPIKAIDVDIRELEGSGVTGTAELSTVGPEDGKIVIELHDAPDGTLALHTHSGPCTVQPTQSTHQLDPVEDGRADVYINASVQGLTHGGFNLSIHEDEDGNSDHIACGEVTTLTRVED